MLGTDTVFNAIFIENFWTSLIMGILFVFYFILSLNPNNYWRGREKMWAKEVSDKIAKATDFKTRIKEDKEKEQTKEREIQNEIKEKRKNRGKTLKAKYKKA